MIRPPYLQKGDKVAIISTARKISEKEILPAVELYKSWGLDVQLGKNLFAESNQFAGTDEERLHDLQWAFDTNEIRAVFCARGGYGTARLLDQLDLKGMQQNPKWLVGYSDVTALHLHLQNVLGLETIHGTMPINIHSKPVAGEQESVGSLHGLLFGDYSPYDLGESINNSKQSCRGVLTGGNLSIVYSLLGSPSVPSFDNSILFLEDLDEYLYHVDRMMLNLKRNGVFNGLQAVIIGGLSDMNDNTVPYGKTAKAIVLEHLSSYGFPVYFDFPAGHVSPNLALPFGREVTILNNKLIA